MRQADLIEALRAVPPFPSPEASLEQVPTPPEMAARLMLEAHAEGDIAGKRVLDLGCGTGMLSLAAHLLGGTVIGVDIDAAALDIARRHVPGDFTHADVAQWEPPQADTVVMNPPFGAQSRHADRPFYRTAAKAVARTGPIYFLALSKTERFLRAQARDLGGRLERLWSMELPIPATHAHHVDDVRRFDVSAFVMTF